MYTMEYCYWQISLICHLHIPSEIGVAEFFQALYSCVRGRFHVYRKEPLRHLLTLETREFLSFDYCSITAKELRAVKGTWPCPQRSMDHLPQKLAGRAWA
jgi:hypothetical protein